VGERKFSCLSSALMPPNRRTSNIPVQQKLRKLSFTSKRLMPWDALGTGRPGNRRAPTSFRNSRIRHRISSVTQVHVIQPDAFLRKSDGTVVGRTDVEDLGSPRERIRVIVVPVTFPVECRPLGATDIQWILIIQACKWS